MAQNINRHLKKRGNIWWYQRRVPAALQDRYPNRSMISESLDTGDLREARRKRDIINGRLAEHELVTPDASRYRFQELVRTLTEDKEKYPYQWDEPYDYDQIAKEDEVMLHALTTVNGRKDQSARYAITLKQATAQWVKDNQASKSAVTTAKVKRSADELLKYLEHYDIKLGEISTRHVYQFICHQQQAGYKTSTIQGNISRLRSIWRHSARMGEVSGSSPFDGHEFGKSDTDKTQAFTAEEFTLLRTKVAESDSTLQLFFKLGAFTGCRPSELTNLRCENIIVSDDITAIFIERGKTNAATRTIPLTSDLGAELRRIKANQAASSLVLGSDAKKMGRQFSRIKTEQISDNPAKCFYSLRVMFATALQQAGVTELHAAAALLPKLVEPFPSPVI
ncbi:DUF6538 domain-containing protein [Vibrio sp. 10N.222.55.C6]|uniref:DUF6538 domain-containing protein n=1 Tax=Vibrio sp. 10N.222.55.C6 TaxID=3229649 RepID=UPI00354B7925